MTTTFNMPQISSSSLESHIQATISVGGNIVVIGRRGSGKTEISKQSVAKSGSKLIYLNLSVLERVDLGGYPDIMKAESYVSYLLPHFFKSLCEGTQECVLLLDEVDKVDQSLTAPLLEITQFKTINGTPLPNLKSCILTGNLIEEGGSRPSLPLLDRAEKFLLVPNTANWLEWAGNEGGINASITSYIYNNQKELFGEVFSEENYADPSPRGWHRASNLINSGKKLNWSEELVLDKVAASVGNQSAVKFKNYYMHYMELGPMLDSLFSGNDIKDKFKKLSPTEQLIFTMMTCSRFRISLDSKNHEAKLNNIVGKFLKLAELETTLVSVNSQITAAKIIKHNLIANKDWQELLAKIGVAFNS